VITMPACLPEWEKHYYSRRYRENRPCF